MKSGVAYFRVVAILLILFGIIGMGFVDQYDSLLGVEASVGGRLWGRGFGATAVGFGVMLWMLDPASDQRQRKIGAIGAALAFGLTGLTDVISVVTGDMPVYGWAFVALNAVLAGLALYYLFTPAPSANAVE